MATDRPEDGTDHRPSGVRLAELLAALSLAADIGLGQPMEHVMRSCLIAMRLGERMGLAGTERANVYWVTLLAWAGCTADSHEVANLFGDDIALRADSYDIDFAGLPLLGFLLRHAGAGTSLGRRARLGAALVVTGGRAVERSLLAHCQVTGAMADRLVLGPAVAGPLQQIFARWDGKGLPQGLGGESISLSCRLLHLADVVEVHHRRGGVEGAVTVARQRRGTQFDPALVDEFGLVAPEVLGGLDQSSTWDDLIAAEPAPGPVLTESELDNALDVMADFADLKSPWFAAHSRGVAELAAAAARRNGHPAAEVRDIGRAGRLHDLGRAGVPNTIWDKPGPLNDSEWEKVRLHEYYTDRMLRRPAALARLGTIASSSHERLDGSGYHRSAPASALPALARILAAADAYHAMCEARPYRPALDPGDAARQLRADARAGTLDSDAAEAVLASAGHAPNRRLGGPAGLTAREVEVLVLVARGASTRQVARLLRIAPKTAGNHIERIYTKIGATSRAGATLFAIQQGLLRTLEPLDVP